jgi:YVTN family beta-propeller protein
MNARVANPKALVGAKSVCMLLLTIGMCGAASAMPDRLIVLNKQESTAVVVDPVSLKVLSRTPTGEGPHEAAVSADGKLAIVANYGAQKPGNSLSIIEIESGKELRRHDLGALTRPHGMQLGFGAANGKVFFTSETTRTVGRYDIASDKVDWVMGTGASATHMLVLSPDGKRLFTSNISSNSVTAIRLDGPPNNANLVQIAVGTQPEAIDISPDGREVWVGQNGDGGISIIDTETNKVKESFKVGLLPIRLKFSPDGKQVLVSDPRGGGTAGEANLSALQALSPTSGEVIVVDVASRKIIKRLPVPGVPLGFQFAPDGKRAFVSRTLARRVDVIDMQKLEVVGSIDTGDGPDGLAWRAGPTKTSQSP